MEHSKLFSSLFWIDFETERTRCMKRYVDSIDKNSLSSESLVTDLQKQFQIEVPTLLMGQKYLVEDSEPCEEIRIVAIPFTGNAEAFRIKPNSEILCYPEDRPYGRVVEGGEQILEIVIYQSNRNTIVDKIRATTQFIENQLNEFRVQAEQYNTGLSGQINSAVEARRQRASAERADKEQLKREIKSI